MAKEPVMGAVKTRLARQIGPVAATYFYRHLLQATLTRLGRDSRWGTLVAVDPGKAARNPAWRNRAPAARIIAQSRGDLGRRMQALLDGRAAGSTLVMGSDIPAVTPSTIARAGKLLAGAHMVFGAAEDGGFWLVGTRGCPRRFAPFRKVTWSSADTLAETVANLRGVRLAYAARHADVDTKADYIGQRWWAVRVVRPAFIPSPGAPRAGA